MRRRNRMQIKVRLRRLILALTVCSITTAAAAQITTGNHLGHGQGRTGRRRSRRDRRPHQRSARHEVGARGHQRHRRLRLPERHAGHLHGRSHDGRLQDRASAPASRSAAATASAVPALTLEPGGAAETVNVTAEAPLIQAQSGERSFAVTTDADREPADRTTATSPACTAFTPGVVAGGASAGGTRLGGAGQNNIMMDGISAMDTGNNGQMLQHEHRVDRRGQGPDAGLPGRIRPVERPADHGRHQERHQPVPRLGLRHQDQLGLEREQLGQREERRPEADQQAQTSTATRSAARSASPAATTSCSSSTRTSTVRRTRPINNGNPIRFRVPTALERAGDFSQTLDNNGALFNLHQGSDTRPAALHARPTRPAASRTAASLGRIPPNRLYPVGLALLNRYPLPNVDAGGRHELQLRAVAPPADRRTCTQQPAIRLDYQLSSKLRVTGKYSGERQRVLITPGHSSRASPTC